MVKLTFLLVVFLMIIVNITTLKILTQNDPKNSSNADQKVIKILKQCFQNTFKTIIASFKSNEYVINFLEELPDTSMILVNNDGRAYNRKWLFSGVIIYVLETNSSEDLGTTLTTLHLLPWWDHRSRFFLIGSSNNSCIDAQKILDTMWTEKILSTVYVCHDHKENIYKILTFNPFTNRAPKPWKLSEDNSSGRWTLYEQLFQENAEICLNLMFDKTKYLDGYEIKAMITHQSNDGIIRNSSLNTWVSTITVPGDSLILDISKLLNVSISVIQVKGGTVSVNYYVKPIVALESDQYDIYLNFRPLFLPYPHKTRIVFRMAMNIFTLRRPFLSPEQKISMFYFRNNVLFICILVPLVFLSAKVLQINKQQEFSTALLEIWHLILSANIRDSLNNIWVRCYFFGIFILFIIVTESFKAHLTSLLTKPDRLEVNTIKNLIDLHYHVYTHEFFKHHQCCGFDIIPKKQLHFYKDGNCSKYINAQTACIAHDVRLRSTIEKVKIHVSEETFYTYAVWMVSPKFPLQQRLDTTILRYFQSGVIDHWYERDWQRKIKKIDSIEAEEVKAQFRLIEFDDILFAFQLLIIGLFCSFIVFIMEISRR